MDEELSKALNNLARVDLDPFFTVKGQGDLIIDLREVVAIRSDWDGGRYKVDFLVPGFAPEGGSWLTIMIYESYKIDVPALRRRWQALRLGKRF